MSKAPAKLLNALILDRCPHCGVASPNLAYFADRTTKDSEGGNERLWRFYQCSRCGGIVSAWGKIFGDLIGEMFPADVALDDAIPLKARTFLQQAVDSLHAPAGAVMLTASAVDAMLKEKGYKKGNLYPRINKAIEDHLITEEMGQWAHEIRLDANDQRHADENADLPDAANASKCVEFARSLAQFLFVLPAQVQRGLSSAQNTGTKQDTDKE